MTCCINFPIFWNDLEFVPQHIAILFVAVTQCNKQKMCSSQWLSLWLSDSVCDSVRRSDSVQQTNQIFVIATQCKKQYWNKYPISLWHVTKKMEKRTKINILSNLNSSTAIKLVWGTSVSLLYLAYTGKARGCSTNTVVYKVLKNCRSPPLPHRATWSPNMRR